MDAKEVKRDGHFVLYDNGIVYDENTGLEWVAGPDKDTTYDEAVAWVSGCGIAGGGFRMPSRIELKSLYRPGKGTSNVMPLLETTGGLACRMTASEALASRTSFSVMLPTAAWMNVEFDLLALEFAERIRDGFQGALHVGLEHDVQLLLLAILELGQKVFES